MNWRPRQPPALRELIAYLVGRSVERGATLNRTKLIKLLYLVDVESVQAAGRPFTSLRWVFFHYGPYAFELIEELEAMEGSEVAVRRYHESVLYVAAPGAPDPTWWPAVLAPRFNRIVDRWAGEELNPLLDYVYFHTEPMRDAVRGEPLDMQLAAKRSTRELPLEAPPAPDDVDDRLAHWRERTSRRFVRVPIHPPVDTVDLPEAAVIELGVRGRLAVRSNDQG